MLSLKKGNQGNRELSREKFNKAIRQEVKCIEKNETQVFRNEEQNVEKEKNQEGYEKIENTDSDADEHKKENGVFHGKRSKFTCRSEAGEDVPLKTDAQVNFNKENKSNTYQDILDRNERISKWIEESNKFQPQKIDKNEVKDENKTVTVVKEEAEEETKIITDAKNFYRKQWETQRIPSFHADNSRSDRFSKRSVSVPIAKQFLTIDEKWVLVKFMKALGTFCV